MVKIISRKPLGKHSVYDIGVERDHNFVLDNGAIASNCFNKSHSTAYAYVTYQTAYLKANYPVEYMTALLTASSDSQEKVEKYRENCQRMGIVVEPPDINRSQKDFTPQGNKILFGFKAVRNLGEGAIENILHARAEGNFKSLADFCTRVELRTVNRRALETLILSGAFDLIKSNRKQLIQDLDLILPWAQHRSKEKESGQLNIFDFISSRKENNINFEQEPSAPPVDDFSIQEKLKLEKENLGFYVSEHPLNSVKKAAYIFSPINLNQLSEQKSKKKVSAVVILNSIKRIVTKKGDSMAFVQIEDISGQAEGVIFPNTYVKIEQILQEDARLIIWGKADLREDKMQLIIDNAESVETAKMLIVELSLPQAIDTTKQKDLKNILQEQSGDKDKMKIPVIAIISDGKMRQFVRLGENFWIENEHTAVESLNNAGFIARIEPLLSNSN
jgi:DNA polymerase III subunit alpha